MQTAHHILGKLALAKCELRVYDGLPYQDAMIVRCSWSDGDYVNSDRGFELEVPRRDNRDAVEVLGELLVRIAGAIESSIQAKHSA